MAKKRTTDMGDPRSIILSKIDVAAQHLRTAVRLFFENSDPAPIYLLAASAREITTTLGDKLGIDTVLTDMAKKGGRSRAELIKDANRFAAFMKHADRDADAQITLPLRDVEIVLQLACHDFGRVTGGMPIEAQVYEVWIYAVAFRRISDAPLRKQEILRRCVSKFPGIRSVDRDESKRIGHRVLLEATSDPALEMQFNRVVKLPKNPAGRKPFAG